MVARWQPSHFDCTTWRGRGRHVGVLGGWAVSVIICTNGRNQGGDADDVFGGQTKLHQKPADTITPPRPPPAPPPRFKQLGAAGPEGLRLWAARVNCRAVILLALLWFSFLFFVSPPKNGKSNCEYVRV